MADHKQNKLERSFENLAVRITNFSGTTAALIIAVFIVVGWALSGPFFGYSEQWQLVINSGTTILTFLMVFVIQRSQNKDSLTTQLKLNEIIASIDGASNRLVDAEDLSESELRTLKSHYLALSRMFKKDIDLKSSHSVEEAEIRHKKKIYKKKIQVMNKFTGVLLLVISSFLFNGCEVIGDIFKAGVWVGIIIVIAVIAVIAFVVKMFSGK